MYRSYILSNFNYCPIVWHFCGIQNSRNMEKIQERALGFVYEDYELTYDILLFFQMYIANFNCFWFDLIYQ